MSEWYFTFINTTDTTYFTLFLYLETLRFYPPLPTTLRECTVHYEIPGTGIVLEKGAKVSIPVAGLQMDPKFYPEPKVFRPARFADNNHKPSPTFMPFGDGPRICIGEYIWLFLSYLFYDGQELQVSLKLVCMTVILFSNSSQYVVLKLFTV